MGSNIDLRKFQSGKGSLSVEDAFARVISGGKPGYKTIIEKRKYPPKCEKCSRIGSNDDKFCPECGGKMIIPLTNCPTCNKEITETEKFCTECGTKLR